jgi:hypothetical protein
MVLLVLFTFLVLSLSHWLLEPLVRWLTPLLTAGGVGWLALAVVLWLLAGASADSPSPSQGRSPLHSSVDLGLDGNQPIGSGFRSHPAVDRFDGVERHGIHEIPPNGDDLT